MLDKHEVPGSIPGRPTRKAPVFTGLFLCSASFQKVARSRPTEAKIGRIGVRSTLTHTNTGTAQATLTANPPNYGEIVLANAARMKKDHLVFRFVVGGICALTMFLTAGEAGLPAATETHFFPTRPSGTTEKSQRGVVLNYAAGNDIGAMTLQDSSGKKHTYYLASTVLYNGNQIVCFGAVGDGIGNCNFPDPNFALDKTLVTVSYFPAKYNGKSASVVDNITSGAAASPSP